jgi:phosphatidylserine decarboxylase
MRWKISRESASAFGVELAAAFLLLILGLWKGYPAFWICLGILAFIIVWTLYFFRDPDRNVPQEDKLILSPADGRVVQVGTIDQLPFCEGAFQCVSIYLSLWNVHINRIPIHGKIKLLQYFPGRFYPAFVSSASKENEQMLIGIESRIGSVFLKQIAGILARRILCRLETGQVVSRGERFGMIKFGSRVELYLPMSVKLYVNEGDRVKAGESVIGEEILNE